MTIKSKLFLATLLTLIALTAFAIISVPLKVSSQLLEKQKEDANKKAQEEKFDAWLDKLQAFECPGCGPRYKHLDSNGQYSYGCLQFQVPTFRSKALQYGVEEDGPDAIYSCELQRAVARSMFRDNPTAAARHWYTSIYVKKLGLPPTL